MDHNPLPTDPESLNRLSREAWEANAEWWDTQVGPEGNQFQRLLIGPATDRLLALQPGEAVLDCACGSGIFSRRMAALGAHVVAFDFSAEFIERAKARTTEHTDRIQYRVLDATDEAALAALGPGRFDAAVCTMALMDMPGIEPLFAALAQLLKPNGRFVFSVLHPAFNSAPGMVLGMEAEDQGGEIVEKRSVKVSRYIRPAAARGVGIIGQPAAQVYFHRPLSVLFNACFRAGFVLDGLEEPVFDDSAAAQRPLGWANFKEIPPVLAARFRLFRIR